MSKVFLKISLYLTALFLPVFFLWAWKQHNHVYPANDNAFYMEISQEIYLNYKSYGLWPATQFAFTHKHWKPIFHPVIGAMFLNFTDGDTRQAIKLYNLVFFATLITIVFLYLNRYLKASGAFVGTVLIAFTPWIFGLATNFNSEIAFITVSIALFYYSITHRSINSLGSAIIYSLLVTLICTFRPVEAALMFFVPSIYFLFLQKRKQLLSLNDIKLLLAWLILFITMLLIPYFLIKDNWTPQQSLIIAISAWVVFVLTLGLVKVIKTNFYFTLFSGLTFSLLISWYVTGSYHLLQWVFATNFQELAIETGNRAGRPFYEFIVFYLIQLGVLPFVYLVLGFSGFKNLKTLVRKEDAVFILGSLLLPFLCGLLSYNGEVRYYYVSWLIVLMVAIKRALSASENKFYLPKIIITALLCTSLIQNLAHNNTPEVPTPLPQELEKYMGRSIFNMYSFAPEIQLQFASEVYRSIQDAKLQNTFLLIDKREAFSYIDPWAQTIIARENGYMWTIDNMHLYKSHSYSVLIHEFIREYHYFIIGPIESLWDKNSKPIEKLGAEIIEDCKKKSATLNLDGITFAYIKRFEIELRPNTKSTYCIYKNVPLNPQPFKSFD